MTNLLALFLCWAPLLSALNFTAVFQRPEEVPVLHHDIPTVICCDEGESQIVFGHGMLIFAEDYAYLCNDLPKLGFVVNAGKVSLDRSSTLQCTPARAPTCCRWACRWVPSAIECCRIQRNFSHGSSEICRVFFCFHRTSSPALRGGVETT
jgi:hypothetical protein